MAKEIGPFTSAVKVVIINPDDPVQVRQVSGSGSPQFQNQSSATFSEVAVAATQRTGSVDYFVDMPSGMSAVRVTPFKMYGSAATAFTDAYTPYTYEPETRQADLQTIKTQAVTCAGGVTIPAATLASTTNITGGTITTTTNLTTNNDKTGYGLSGAAVQAIWDAATSALTTVGSIGKWILDKLDVVLSTRLASASYSAPPTAVANRQEMDSNSTKLAAIKAQTDLIATTAGDSVEVQTGLAALGLVGTAVGAIKLKTDNLPASPAAVGSQMDLVNAPNAMAVTAIQSGLAPSATALSTAQWTNAKAGTLPTTGTIATNESVLANHGSGDYSATGGGGDVSIEEQDVLIS